MVEYDIIAHQEYLESGVALIPVKSAKKRKDRLKSIVDPPHSFKFTEVLNEIHDYQYLHEIDQQYLPAEPQLIEVKATGHPKRNREIVVRHGLPKTPAVIGPSKATVTFR